MTGFLYVRNTDHSTLFQTPPGQNSSRHTVDSSAGGRQPTKQFPLRKALPSPRRSQMTTNAETQMCAARSQRCCRTTTHTPNRFSGLQPSSAPRPNGVQANDIPNAQFTSCNDGSRAILETMSKALPASCKSLKLFTNAKARSVPYSFPSFSYLVKTQDARHSRKHRLLTNTCSHHCTCPLSTWRGRCSEGDVRTFATVVCTLLCY